MKRTEETMHMVHQLDAARKLATKLDGRFGSGLNVSITNYTTGGYDVEEVTIHAELAGPMVKELIHALEESLKCRREMLRGELVNVDKVLDGSAQ